MQQQKQKQKQKQRWWWWWWWWWLCSDWVTQSAQPIKQAAH